MLDGDLLMGEKEMTGNTNGGNLLPGDFVITLQENQASSQHQDSG